MPWFLLHPCQTAEFMALLLSRPAANSATAGATSKATSETCTVQPARAVSGAPAVGLLHARCGFLRPCISDFESFLLGRCFLGEIELVIRQRFALLGHSLKCVV